MENVWLDNMLATNNDNACEYRPHMDKIMWPDKTGKLYPYVIKASEKPYVDALGIELAVTLFLNFGGSPVYIAENPTGGMLQGVIGVEGHRALCRFFGGPQQLPRIPIANELIVKFMAAKGVATIEIARQVRVSDVSVRSILSSPSERLKQKRKRLQSLRASIDQEKAA